jgi:hypothetical protein
MSEQMVLTVLNEVLGELKEANKSLKEMGGTIKALESKVTGFEQMLKDQQVVVQPPDLASAFEEIRQLTTETGIAASETINIVQKEAGAMLGQVRMVVEQKLSEIGTVIDGRLAEQPKPIMRQWRVSLFPESDREGSYKYFVNWLFGGTVLVLLVGALFLLGRQFLDKWHPSAEERKQAMSIPEVKAESEVKAAVPSVVRHQASPARQWERDRKKEKTIDSLKKVAIQLARDFLRKYQARQPEKSSPGGIAVDSFYDIKK